MPIDASGPQARDENRKTGVLYLVSFDFIMRAPRLKRKLPFELAIGDTLEFYLALLGLSATRVALLVFIAGKMLSL